jgi:sentrin-specific protease 1
MLLKELHYYDSLSKDGRRYLNAALQWISDEHLDKKQILLDTSEWRCFHQETVVPQQDNGFDCGVFTIMCARAIAYNQPLHSYQQKDMPRYRRMIGRHILRQSLLDLNNQSVPYMFDLPPSNSATVLPASQPVNSFHSKVQNRTRTIHSSSAISGSRTTSNTNSFHSKI